MTPFSFTFFFILFDFESLIIFTITDSWWPHHIRSTDHAIIWPTSFGQQVTLGHNLTVVHTECWKCEWITRICQPLNWPLRQKCATLITDMARFDSCVHHAKTAKLWSVSNSWLAAVVTSWRTKVGRHAQNLTSAKPMLTLRCFPSSFECECASSMSTLTKARRNGVCPPNRLTLAR